MAKQWEDTFQWKALKDDMPFQGDDIMCAEVLVRAHPDNKGRAWVRTMGGANPNNSMPLDKREGIVFETDNLSNISARIEKIGDVIIVCYSVGAAA